MANITVRNIPDDLYARLKTAARLHHRSINGEIIACIEQSLRPRRRPVEDVLARIRGVRERLGASWTAEEIEAAIDQGRG